MENITREKFEDIIKKINEAKANSLYSAEDKLCLLLDETPYCIMQNLDVDEHRWYEKSTSVYKIGEWFLGLHGASKMYSEQSSFGDLCVETEAFEMEEVASVTYKMK